MKRHRVTIERPNHDSRLKLVEALTERPCRWQRRGDQHVLLLVEGDPASLEGDVAKNAGGKHIRRVALLVVCTERALLHVSGPEKGRREFIAA